MSKHLLSWWILALSIYLTFLSTVLLYFYWTITHAPLWLCNLMAFTTFTEGVAIGLWVLGKWTLVALLNKVFRFFDVQLVPCDYLAELEEAQSALAYAQHCANQAEQELEERLSEQGALKVKVALLNLRYEAEAIGYQVHWIKEGEGERFFLIAGDEPLPFVQTLDDIEHALEMVLHDAAATVESEVH